MKTKQSKFTSKDKFPLIYLQKTRTKIVDLYQFALSVSLEYYPGLIWGVFHKDLKLNLSLSWTQQL